MGEIQRAVLPRSGLEGDRVKVRVRVRVRVRESDPNTDPTPNPSPHLERRFSSSSTLTLLRSKGTTPSMWNLQRYIGEM